MAMGQAFVDTVPSAVAMVSGSGPVAGFPAGPAVSGCWPARMAGGRTFAAGEASARAWG